MEIRLEIGKKESRVTILDVTLIDQSRKDDSLN